MKKGIEKKLQKLSIAFVAALLLVQALDATIRVVAEESNKIGLSDTYGERYGQDITKKKVNKPTKAKNKQNVLKREASVSNDESPYVGYDEVESERTESSKTYEISEGSYVKEMFFEPIHKEEDGKLIDIDNTLENTSKSRSSVMYENTNGLYGFRVQEQAIQISGEDNQTIEMIHNQGDVSLYDVKENVIQYTNVYDHVDMEVRLSGDKVSTTYQINGANAQNEFKYQVKLHGLTPKQETDSIDFLDNNDKSVYQLIYPKVEDANNKGTASSFSYTSIDNDTIEVSYKIETDWLTSSDRVYPIKVSTRADYTPKSFEMDSSYIRSTQPNVTSSYYDLIVGYDDGRVNGFEHLGVTRAFFHAKNFSLGANKKVMSANLNLYKKSVLAGQWNEIIINKLGYYRGVGGITWANKPLDSEFTQVSKTNIGNNIGMQSFDVTTYIQDLNAGANNIIELRASNESAGALANAFWNDGAEADEKRPTITVSYRDAWDVDPTLDINQMDNELRIFGKKEEGFFALSLDGIAKPDSQVLFDLLEKTEGDAREKINTIVSTKNADKMFVDPIYKTNPITGVQTYPKSDINYTTNYVYDGGIPKYDTFYEYQMRVRKPPEGSNKVLYSDGFIKYKVKLGDTLKSISAYYGVPIALIKSDNNLESNEIAEDQVLLVRFKKNNPKVPKDVYTPPLKTETWLAEYVYRGPECYGVCYVGDPINTTNGNFYHESEDFTLQDYEEMSLKRYYNSTGPQISTMFGNRFTTTLEQYLAYDKDKNILFFRGDGKILQIKKDGSSYQVDKEDRITYKRVAKTHEIKDLESRATYIFDDFGTLTQIINNKGFKTEVMYNEYGQITSAKMGEKSITFAYNENNLVSRVTLPSGKKVSYEYDQKRNLTAFNDLAGKGERYTYDENNFLTSVTDKNGNQIANNVYDDKGVIQSQKDGNGNKLSFAYDGDETKTTYADDTSFTYAFENNKVTKIENDLGESSSYVYDDLGNIVKKTDAAGEVTTYEYDKFHMTKAAYPDGTSEAYTYNANGNITKYTNKEGGIERFVYDGIDVIQHTKVDGTFTTYTYDANHRVQSETNELGATKTYTYSGNQVRSITSSNGLVEEFVYDANGNVIRESDNQGKTTGYIYDDNNQMIQKSYPDGTSETWTYDGIGNIKGYKDRLGGISNATYDKNNNETKMVKGALTTKKTYDVFDRVVSEVDAQGLKTKKKYDVNGNVSSETDAYGKKETFVYDEAGKLLLTRDVQGNEESNEYKNDNVVKTVAFDGLETTFEYDGLNRQIAKKNPNGMVETTEYDGLLVVKQVDEFQHETVFTYDAFGRETKSVKTAGDHITTKKKRYDNYNNVIEESVNGVATTYTYDVYNRLKTTTDALGNVSENFYDYDDHVVKEVDALGFSKETIYNGVGEVIKEVDKNGNASTKNYDVNGALISEVDANGFATNYAYNEKGQVVSSTDPYGVTSTFTYDAYGNTIKTHTKDVLVEEKKYDDFGQEVEVESTTSHTSTTYDTLGRAIKTTNELTGLTSTNEYDTYGNVIQVSDNNKKTETTAYDQYQRVIKTVDPLGRTEETIYDESGNVIETKGIAGSVFSEYNEKNEFIKTTNVLGLETTMTYDVLGRKVEEVSDEKKLITTYDANGQVVEVNDTNRNTNTTTTYDGNGNVIKEVDALGNTTKTTYDAKNQVIKTTDALGNEHKTEFDANGNIVKEIDAVGNTKQTAYNEFGLIEQEMDERGFTTKYTYNDKLQLTEIEDKTGRTSKVEYNDAKQVAKEIDPNGNEKTMTYDIAGNVIESVDGNDVKTRFTYDVLGNVVKEELGARKTSHSYDEKGNIASTKINNKTTETNRYNDNNQLVQTRDALNNATTYEYDVFGNQNYVDDKGYQSKSTFNVYGEELKRVENAQYVQEFTYDKNHRMLETKTNGRISEAKTYDANGNILKSSENTIEKEMVYDALNREIELKLSNQAGNEMITVQKVTYDESGNPTVMEDAYGAKEVNTYDANHNVISSTNKLGKTDLFEYDGLNNMVKAQNPQNRVVSYAYDASNNVTLKNINGKYASYQYDVYGNLTKEKNEYGYRHQYTYDVYGNKVKQVKPDGQSISFAYDANNNMTAKGNNIFAYDKRGNVIEAQNQEGIVKYTYDAFDQIQSVSDTQKKRVSYTYNKDKQLSGIQYPNKTKVTYSYNDMGRLKDVAKNSKTVASYTYTKRGDIASITQPNVVSQFTYDEMSRKVAQTTKKSGKNLYQASYAYDANDNLTKEVINGKTNTYTYNDAEELKESKKYVGDRLVTTTYGYDAFGNKTVNSSKDGTTTYTYNNKNQLEKVDSSKGYTSYYYDGNGNLKNKVKADGSQETYQYDLFDRMTQMSQGAYIYDYAYDAQDERIQQTKTDIRDYPSVAWYDSYFDDSWSERTEVKDKDVKTTFKVLREQVAKKKANGNVCSVTYADGHTESNAVHSTYKLEPEVTNYTLNRNTEYTEVILSNNKEAIYGEGLLEENGVTQVTGLNDSVVATTKGNDTNIMSYTDYGVNDKIGTGHAYNGELQEETGLIYLRARYYDPTIGNFIQIDNKYDGEQGKVTTQNRYAYSLNNPYKYVDRDGEKAKKPKKPKKSTGAASATGAGVGAEVRSALAALLAAAVAASAKAISYIIGGIAGAATQVGSWFYDTFLNPGKSNRWVYGANGDRSYNPYNGMPLYCPTGKNGISLYGNNKSNSKAASSSATAAAGSPKTPNDPKKDKDKGSGNIKEKVNNLVDKIRNRNGTPPDGYKGNKTFENRDGRLPNGNYKEYDLHPSNSNADRGLERIVIGDDGSVWYTPDHYETFTRIK